MTRWTPPFPRSPGPPQPCPPHAPLQLWLATPAATPTTSARPAPTTCQGGPHHSAPPHPHPSQVPSLRKLSKYPKFSVTRVSLHAQFEVFVGL